MLNGVSCRFFCSFMFVLYSWAKYCSAQEIQIQSKNNKAIGRFSYTYFTHTLIYWKHSIRRPLAFSLNSNCNRPQWRTWIVECGRQKALIHRRLNAIKTFDIYYQRAIETAIQYKRSDNKTCYNEQTWSNKRLFVFICAQWVRLCSHLVGKTTVNCAHLSVRCRTCDSTNAWTVALAFAAGVIKKEFTAW